MMQLDEDIPERTSRPDFLTGGGDVAAIMRSMDWSKTKLGPIVNWPQSLKTALSLVLSSRFELFIWWGPDLIMLYNDAYRQTLAAKHPWALGRPGSEVWSEIWNVIGPMLRRVLTTGEATWSDDLLLFLERHGYSEETYHTFSYSPIRGESGQVVGVFTAVTQTTERVIGERRLRTLRDLGVRGTDATSELEAWARAVEVLLDNPYDVPFAALYRLSDETTIAEAAAYAGITADHPFTPMQVDLAGQSEISRYLSQVVQSGQTLELSGDKLGFDFPGGAWEESPCEMLIVPLVQGSQTRPLGILVAGVSGRKRLDDNYRTFFNLLAGQIGRSVADAQAYELQKKRAEALAELDRAKTAFFSNVSHEFRTPLTLMLGPVEDALTDVASPLPAKQKERMETLQRNALRLLKLVNTLLDFSRIEAGRIQAVYEPTDLSAFTADLASVFRSATERAGIKLVIDCSPLPEPVYIDREMWEKIVLNLLSNAFKFTFQGEIEVCLRGDEGHAELLVRDTGTGIAEHEIAHVFERFRRVQGARGRTHEGTGIGLALVDELVRLHGGTVRAESKEGKGSTFRVRIPLGHQHLPGDRIMASRNMPSTAVGAAPYLHEALRWLPNADEAGAFIKESGNEDLTALFPEESETGNLSAQILLADDNRDMREYVTRLLRSKFQVTAVENGERALESARRTPPDLVLTDVMMPGLDGFGLLKALRDDPKTASIPVVMLSARAGEEARSEGMEAGADDYLVKPFTARELLARVTSHVSMHRFRRELMSQEHDLRLKAESAEHQYREILESISEGFLFLSSDWTIKYLNSHGAQIARKSPKELVGQNYWQAFPETLGTEIERAFREALSQNRVVRVEEFYAPLAIWLALNVYPSSDGLSVFFRDVTENKKQAQALLLSEKLAATGRLAATIAHEINNPLEAVVNLLFLARRAPNSDPKVQKYLETAEKEMNRVAHIARQTLGFYRDTSTPTTVNVPDLLDDVISVYQSRLRSRNISVQKSYQTTSAITGLKGEIHQVFSNLVSNAIDAMEGGGVLTLSVNEEEHLAQRGVKVAVEDNGSGIREADLPRLFEPFFTTKRNVGTGLGLWVVKQFVENHRGYVAAEQLGNGAGHGTRFSVFLPSVFREADRKGGHI